MTDSKSDTDAAIKDWYTKLLDKAVKEMIDLKAITGVAVQASPIWMVPSEVLIAKVWGVGHENDFVWTIAIDKLIADYVAGTLAASPRDVARHFSMKWQLDADRLLSLQDGEAPVKISSADAKAYAEKLIQTAEMLYDFANRDDAWEERQSFAD